MNAPRITVISFPFIRLPPFPLRRHNSTHIARPARFHPRRGGNTGARRPEVPDSLAVKSGSGTSDRKRHYNHRFASAHNFPKFVKVLAAMDHELRKVGTGMSVAK